MNQNVLLVVIDQFRADCLTEWPKVMGNTLPNLQALMKESVTFNQHYTVTTPCGPSRASLLTGLYAMNHRSIRNGTPLADHHKTLGNYVREAGMEPWLFGYSDASADPYYRVQPDPDLKDYEGLSQGFAERLRMRLESPGPWIGYLKNKGYQLPDNYWDIYRAILDTTTATPRCPDGSPIRSPALYDAADSDTAFLTDRALEVLSAESAKNWFSLVTYIKPHPPLIAPKPFNTLYDPSELPQPSRPVSVEDLMLSHPIYRSSLTEPNNTGLYQGFDGSTSTQSLEEIAELRSVYLGLATEVDQHIGRLLSFLKDTGQYQDTLIIVTADHGEMLGDSFLWGKNFPFEAALKIPLIIRDPRQPSSQGSVINAPTESIDIAPTILQWVGSDLPAALDGRSLLPLWQNETTEVWRKHLFAEAELGEPDKPTTYQKQQQLHHSQANYAVLSDGQHKYVHFNGGVPPMLFDLLADPGETVNVACDTRYAEVLQKMRSLMLDHRMTHAEHSRSGMKLTAKGVLGFPKKS